MEACRVKESRGFGVWDVDRWLCLVKHGVLPELKPFSPRL